MKKMLLLIAGCCFAANLFGAGEPFAAWNFDQVQDQIISPAVGKWSLKLLNPANVKHIDGKNGKAVAFLGADKERGTVGGAYVSGFSFDCTQPFTIEVVFKLNADSGYRNFKEIICFSDGERGPGLRVTVFYDKIVMGSGDGKASYSVATDASKTAITKDKWHFLTLTYDGKTASIYWDGVLAASKEMAITKGKYNALFLGSLRNAYAYALQGAIDELKFYNYAKTAAETAEAFLAFSEE